MEIKGREKILAIGLGACIVLWLLNLFVIDPLTASWHNRAKRIDDLRKQIADGNMLVRRGPYLQDRWNSMLTNSLPSDPAAAERKLFAAFDGWIQTSGVTQGSFRPELHQNDDGYSTLECRADVTGNMENVERFLFELEKDPLALKLNSVELTARDDNGRQLALVMEMSALMIPTTSDQ